MIDQEWLGKLDFVRPDGMHIQGLAGIGSEKVVLDATAADGHRLVLQTYRHVLGYPDPGNSDGRFREADV